MLRTHATSINAQTILRNDVMNDNAQIILRLMRQVMMFKLSFKLIGFRELSCKVNRLLLCKKASVKKFRGHTVLFQNIRDVKRAGKDLHI